MGIPSHGGGTGSHHNWPSILEKRGSRKTWARAGERGTARPQWPVCAPVESRVENYLSLDFIRWPAPGTASECAGLPTIVGRRVEGGKKPRKKGREGQSSRPPRFQPGQRHPGRKQTNVLLVLAGNKSASQATELSSLASTRRNTTRPHVGGPGQERPPP